jgi:hypothetical protein
MFHYLRLLISLAAVIFHCAGMDLRSFSIRLDPEAPVPVRTAARMLSEEVEIRTRIRIPVVTRSSEECIDLRVDTRAGLPAEGYRIRKGGICAIEITGSDPRGVLFGVGRLLRELKMTPGRAELPSTLNITSAPRFPVRGHQLGYRSANNTYDAWTVSDYERYIRDMAVFGANTVELTGAATGREGSGNTHFPVAPLRMHQEVSRLTAEYGLDFSIWLPADEKSYDDPTTVERALREWDAAFRALPKLDAVFVPGGDPGHTEPRVLMPFLEKAAAVLRRHHPKAGLWVSPQGMDDKWLKQFYSVLQIRPRWLAGVVHGPWVRVPMREFRAAVPASIPIRLYPDITHTLRCQFPLQDWDPALAFTHSREPINPMPVWQSGLFRDYVPGSVGFVSYSDGANDDVNKVIWTALAWDPDAKPEAIVREFARYFTGVDAFAEGLLALEKNWQGPLVENAGVEATLRQFQSMEQAGGPRLRRNWRFQQALYRAAYDAYVRRRLVYETKLESEARVVLRTMAGGSAAAMTAAERILLRAESEHVAPDLRARTFALAEGLFQSIGMQLSVATYGGSGWERGVTLDRVDTPLNNREWLIEQFHTIRDLPDEQARRTAILALLDREDPGPGGFYDNLGNPSRQPHFVPDGGLHQQGFWEIRPGPLAWKSHANSWRGRPVRLRYSGLDTAAAYKVRVVYGGEDVLPQQGIRLRANGVVVHPYLPKPMPVRPVEFSIPREATRGGELVLEWDREEPPSGRLRGAQVSEVWLIRTP